MTKPTPKSDWEIQQDVERELAWDTRISPTEVGIQVNRGIVTLTGTVESWGKVRAAEEAAHRARDVLDVANELVVRSAEAGARSDAEIAQAVRQALEWDVTVPDAQIRTTVTKGVVTLAGSVAEWRQRLDAERAIEHLRAVKRVVNHIEVRPTQAPDIAVARRAVEAALERHVAHEASRIEIDAHEGIVKVSGVVSTPEERRAVLGALRGLHGVREIDDDDRRVTRLSLTPAGTAGRTSASPPRRPASTARPWAAG